MKWLTETYSVAVYASIHDVIAIHGHNGKTVVEWEPTEYDWVDLPLWAVDPVGYFEGC